MAGIVHTFRGDVIYRWSTKHVESCFTSTTTNEPSTTNIKRHSCATISIEHHERDLTTATVTTTSIIATTITATPTQQGDFRW